MASLPISSYLASSDEESEMPSRIIKRSTSSMDTSNKPISPLKLSIQKDYQTICTNLTKELRSLNHRIKFLESENELLAVKLSEQIAMRSKLQISKEEMTRELEELSKSLFEEANELVAKESKHRHQLQLELEYLKKKLEELQESYDLEIMQSRELRRMVKQINTDKTLPSTDASIELTFSMMDIRPKTFEEWKDLLSIFSIISDDPLVKANQDDLKMNLIKSAITSDYEKKIWSQVNLSLYQEFVEWLTNPDKDSSTDHNYEEEYDDHALVQRIWEQDISPTLTFSLKNKSFSRRLAKAIAANRVTIEPILTESPKLHQDSPSDSIFLSRFSRLTNLSLPDIISSTDKSNDTCSIRPATPLLPTSCSLCGMITTKMHKFHFEGTLRHQLSPLTLFLNKEQRSNEILIDENCRARIVSVCDYFAFLRHYHQGLYEHSTDEALFFQWIHLLRGMFYARTAGPGYFIVSDLACFKAQNSL